jgi:hypothetical protein
MPLVLRGTILTFLLIAAPAAEASSLLHGGVDFRDKVPRDRLLSDAEFLRVLDLERKEFAGARKLLSEGDTAHALQEVATYFRNRTAPRYFFSTVEFQKRLEQFAASYTGAAITIVADAHAFMRTYGSDVDWKVPGRDRLGRAHRPNTIRFLARQSQAENIALAYYLEGRKSADLGFLMNHVRDFIRDYETGLTESGANDVFERFYGGHRARSWLAMHHLLLASPDYSWKDQIFLIKVFLLHGARLIDVCEKFNWGNHQLVGLTGIYEVSLMYPEFPVMREWNRKALKTILEHLTKEIPPDGFQCERASHYFKLDILNYFRVYRLSMLNGIDLPPIFKERFKAMFDALVSVAMPNKRVPVLQDGQARYDPWSNDVAELPEPTEEEYLSLGSALFGDPTYKFFGREKFPSSLFWFLSTDQIQAYETLPPKQPSVLSVGLPQSHYYVMRTGWEKDDLYLIIDGGLAQDKPDHTHGGILGLIAYGFGAEILPSYPVRYSAPDYRILKNSLVKSVALVDTLLQGRGWIENNARTGFGRWQKLPLPSGQEWLSGSSADFFSAKHNGFEDAGVRYGRSVLFLKPACWLVIDEFSSASSHTYTQIWQGNYQIDEKAHSALQKLDGARLKIIQLEGDDFSIKNQSVASTSGVVFEKKHNGSFRFLTLLLPAPVSREVDPLIEHSTRGATTTTSIGLGDSRWTFTESDGALIGDGHIATDARAFLRSTHESLRTYWMHAAQSFSDSVLEIRFPRRSSFEITQTAGRGTTITVLRSDSDSVSIKTNNGPWQSYRILIGKVVSISERHQLDPQ